MNHRQHNNYGHDLTSAPKHGFSAKIIKSTALFEGILE
jgi:hypothetical protein